MLKYLILLLTILVSSGAKCPSMCICRHFPRETLSRSSSLFYTSIKCEGGRFDANVTLINTTRILVVSNLGDESSSDLIETLMNNDLPELNTFALLYSSLSNVSAILDVVGDRVNSLTLSHDNLTVIPDLSDNLDNVVSIDFSNNVITKLPFEHSLQTLRTLERLNFSANAIKQIDPNTFSNLTSLKILDLSRNSLTILNTRLFETLTTLQYLNLSFNRLETLKDDCFYGLVKLQQLDVSWNNLVLVTAGSLQLQSLTRLLLAGNTGLGNATEVIVEVGKKLHTVDASNIGLKQVPGTLTRSIRTLKLMRNCIRMVTCGELDAYPLLQLVDFSWNDIVFIEDDALGRQEFLSVLYLSNNKLQSIPKSLPERLSVLHLECNSIEKVSKDDLLGLSNLEVLLLNDNKIGIVEGGAFTYLRSLVTLDLSRNSIKALDPGNLSGPSALQILRLSGIDTMAPAKDMSFPLSAPDHLVILDLSGSAGLARQLLADTAALVASRELQELDISGTDLEYIRPDLFHYLPELRIIRVKDNRLNCTNLQWFAQWLRRQDQMENRHVTCASPPEFWGMPLLDLQDNEISPPAKEINHERSQDFERTINLAQETNAIQNNDPLRKFVQQTVDGTITNGLINNFNVTKNDTVDKNSTFTTGENKRDDFQLSNINEGTEEDNFIFKRVSDKDTTTIKTLNEKLVSSADLELSSLIPLSNKQKEPFAIRSTVTTRIQDYEAGVVHDFPNQRKVTEKWHSSSKNNGSNVARNKAQNAFNSTTTSGLAKYNQSQNSQLKEVNMMDNFSQRNASMIKTSMFRNEEDQKGQFLHPGMIILAVGILCGAATLATLASRFNKRKRWIDRSNSSDDMAVTGISNVTELW
ncbi:hypothetical protein ABEB36_005178 [Hypothenemus hampei]|uniref:LRRCT domain-containing protein n=1 Tax=Hypothenemus hampei TaxID=57062 RepID=A0ABD1F0B7_HYPHA